MLENKAKEGTPAALVADSFMLVALGVLFAMGADVCARQPAEDLVAVINSVTHPTFYFPGSNRIFNVVGMVASGISDVQWNYDVQGGIRLLLAIAWPYAAFRLVLRPRWCLLATIIFHAIVLLQFSRMAIDVVYLSINPYSSSLFFLASALLVLREGAEGGRLPLWRWAAGVLLALVGCSIAPTNAIYVLLVLLIYGGLRVPATGVFRGSPLGVPQRALQLLYSDRAWRIGAYIGAILALVFVTAAGHATLYSWLYPGAVRSFSSPTYVNFAFSFHAVARSVRNLLWETGGSVLLLEIVAFVAMMLWARTTPVVLRSTNANRWLIALVAAAFPYILMVAQLSHVRDNGPYHARYFIVVALVVVLAVVAKSLDTLAGWLARRFELTEGADGGIATTGYVALMLFFALACTRVFGWPALTCPMPDSYRSKAGLYAARNDYFAILGSYWDVWPAIFNAWRVSAVIPASERVMPTGWRAETMVPALRDLAVDRLIEHGSLRMLCVGKGTSPPEYGSRADCSGMLKWNQDFGLLPAGIASEAPSPLGPEFADVLLTLPSVAVGQILDLRAAADPAVLLSGWWPPEKDGSWTVGNDARIAFRLECATAGEFDLKLDLHTWVGAFASTGEALDIGLYFNGTHVADWKVTSAAAAASYVAAIPGAVVKCGGPNVVDLELAGVRSLRQMGLGADERKLGLLVKSVSIDRR